VAIPLLQDDCKDPDGSDLDWIWDVIHLTSDDRTRRLDLDALRKEVKPGSRQARWMAFRTACSTATPDVVAREWLARAGKRCVPS